uniref:Uncharacterized protein n=1 Tax=Brassica oleracea var. oleracea TaxID=109376 RepID=A0A0D2ZZJ5_BRAOL
EAIGNEESPLPYLSPELRGRRLLNGANFASAGIGILNDTGFQFVSQHYKNVPATSLLPTIPTTCEPLDWDTANTKARETIACTNYGRWQRLREQLFLGAIFR